MSWLLWVIGYYIVSRITLIIGTVFLTDAKLDPPTSDEPPMLILICAPLSGEVLMIMAPFILSFVSFYKFGKMLERSNDQMRLRHVTKTKLLELKDLNLKLQEAELDKELELAKQKYNKRQMSHD